MATPSKARGFVTNDEETDAIIHQGASLSQLSTIFKMDQRDLKLKVSQGNVKPCGERRGFPIYQIYDVAPHLAKKVFTDEELERLITKMTIADLPPILRKEFWAGLRSRQLFEKEAATLIKADDAVSLVEELLKTLRLSLLLSRDIIERETELTENQRHIVNENIDRALESAHDAVVRRFGEIKERQEIVTDDEEL